MVVKKEGRVRKFASKAVYQFYHVSASIAVSRSKFGNSLVCKKQLDQSIGEIRKKLAHAFLCQFFASHPLKEDEIQRTNWHVSISNFL